MALFDIFSKRRTFLPLYEQAWAAIRPHIMPEPAGEDEAAARLALFYLASILYSTVYQACVAAGMTTSSAYSMARGHLAKSPFAEELRLAVDAIFLAEEGSRERRYADVLQATIARIVSALAAGHPLAVAAIEAELAELRRVFAASDCGRDGLSPHPPA
ncbi:hypothetical protein JCM30471_03850 [Desulfuromonas carbonis]|uniref:hypothetical protein n=1 Tax=Desulfuromonas sp. DDH964 TaxID=1823759 RepID=UPI00078C81A5|nr:hypothetical protein [Desulfuromonas sp. DDH964]AMV71561.1 hypothetical protein DBW_1187 [Desulfuromonas sp. DDH964]